MQMGGEGPWTGTVFGHLLERDDKRELSCGETQKSVLFKDYTLTFYLFPFSLNGRAHDFVCLFACSLTLEL